MIGDPLVSSYGSYQHNSRYDTSEDSKVSLGDLSSTPSSGSTFFHVGMVRNLILCQHLFTDRFLLQVLRVRPLVC